MVRAAQAFGLNSVPESKQREILRVERLCLLDQPEVGALPVRVFLLYRKPQRQFCRSRQTRNRRKFLHQLVEAILPVTPGRRNRFVAKRVGGEGEGQTVVDLQLFADIVK